MATSKSAQIRQMAAQGMSTGQIAKALDIRFQFAYNVLQADKNKKILAEAKKNEAKKA